MRLGKPKSVLTAEEQKKYDEANNLFVGCIISNLSDRLVCVYIDETEAKMLWDALVAKYDATDVGNELYLMESFHDYRMVNNVLWWNRRIRCNALSRILISLSVLFPTSLWLDALLQSCLSSGGTSPQL